MFLVTRSKLAFTRNLLKCNTDLTKKSRLAATVFLVAQFLHGLGDMLSVDGDVDAAVETIIRTGWNIFILLATHLLAWHGAWRSDICGN